MIDEVAKLDEGPRSIETGAGNSSLLFMMLGCSHVTAIAPDEKLRHRILSEAAQRGLDHRVFRHIEDRPRSPCLVWRSTSSRRARSP